jgi:hypothetical protein
MDAGWVFLAWNNQPHNVHFILLYMLLTKRPNRVRL